MLKTYAAADEESDKVISRTYNLPEHVRSWEEKIKGSGLNAEEEDTISHSYTTGKIEYEEACMFDADYGYNSHMGYNAIYLAMTKTAAKNGYKFYGEQYPIYIADGPSLVELMPDTAKAYSERYMDGVTILLALKEKEALDVYFKNGGHIFAGQLEAGLDHWKNNRSPEARDDYLARGIYENRKLIREVLLHTKRDVKPVSDETFHCIAEEFSDDPRVLSVLLELIEEEACDPKYNAYYRKLIKRRIFKQDKDLWEKYCNIMHYNEGAQ